MEPQDNVSPSERRDLARYRLQSGTTVACRKASPADSPELRVDPLNLSATGLRLFLREALAPGEEIRLDLSAAALPAPLHRQGKVVWVLELPASGYYYAGVHFDHPLPAADLQRLSIIPE